MTDETDENNTVHSGRIYKANKISIKNLDMHKTLFSNIPRAEEKEQFRRKLLLNENNFWEFRGNRRWRLRDKYCLY